MVRHRWGGTEVRQVRGEGRAFVQGRFEAFGKGVREQEFRDGEAGIFGQCGGGRL